MNIVKAFIAVVCGVVGATGCTSRTADDSLAVSRATTDAIALEQSLIPVDLSPNEPSAPEMPSESERRLAMPENPRVAKFAELDIDDDGQLSIAEFGAGRRTRDAEKWFGRRDADRDGWISLLEFVPKSAPARHGTKDEQAESEMRPQNAGVIDGSGPHAVTTEQAARP